MSLRRDWLPTTTSVAMLFQLASNPALAEDSWSGVYVGAHLGLSGGKSTPQAYTGDQSAALSSIDFFHGFDLFDETGSASSGVQFGYNRLLENRVLLGIEADASFGSWLNAGGYSVGGTSTFLSPTGDRGSLTQTSLAFGTVRGRVGYLYGPWLFFATAGLSWSLEKRILNQDDEEGRQENTAGRLGWVAGGGVEVPIVANWTGRAEFLVSSFGSTGIDFSGTLTHFETATTMHQARVALNYHFSDAAKPSDSGNSPPSNWFSVQGQATVVEQAHPRFRSAYSGPSSLPNGAVGRETLDATLYVGVRPWQGAEFWFNPELDQGFGIGNTHGVAGFPSGASYKLGADVPYTRIQRAFLRQTIDLGGESQKVDADVNQFAGTQTANRIVLTAGRYSIADIFDTNKYANNPKTDFLNWALINAGTFDYAGDGWGYTYGAAAEFYLGTWSIRAGAFDLSATPASGDSPLAFGLDPTFSQIQAVGEIEKRLEVWGQPGKVKITGYLSHGKAAYYKDAVALALATGQPADTALVRNGYTLRPGVSLNVEQQISDSIGMFLRAGWADGRIEVWDFSDIQHTIAAGVQITGKAWGRSDDTIGVAAVINGGSSELRRYLDAGGNGVLIGDGKLPNATTEKILETYYSYALNSSIRLSADYQFIAGPGYNADRGPVSVFAGRLHTRF